MTSYAAMGSPARLCHLTSRPAVIVCDSFGSGMTCSSAGSCPSPAAGGAAQLAMPRSPRHGTGVTVGVAAAATTRPRLPHASDGLLALRASKSLRKGVASSAARKALPGHLGLPHLNHTAAPRQFVLGSRLHGELVWLQGEAVWLLLAACLHLVAGCVTLLAAWLHLVAGCVTLLARAVFEQPAACACEPSAAGVPPQALCNGDGCGADAAATARAPPWRHSPVAAAAGGGCGAPAALRTRAASIPLRRIGLWSAMFRTARGYNASVRAPPACGWKSVPRATGASAGGASDRARVWLPEADMHGHPVPCCFGSCRVKAAAVIIRRAGDEKAPNRHRPARSQPPRPGAITRPETMISGGAPRPRGRGRRERDNLPRAARPGGPPPDDVAQCRGRRLSKSAGRRRSRQQRRRRPRSGPVHSGWARHRAGLRCGL
eukprot:365738-Chlamydomonas_euryale.AAC.5